MIGYRARIVSRLAGLGLMFIALASAAAPMEITRHHAFASIPPKLKFVMSTYVHEDSVVVHLQSDGRDDSELLIDARTGLVWPGSLQELLQDYRRLDSESPADTLRAPPHRADLHLLAELGCVQRHRACTSPEDSDLLLFVGYDREKSRIEFDLVDLRGLLDGMTRLLAGQIDPRGVSLSESDWRVIEWASRQSSRREAWIDALRSISDQDAYDRVREAYSRGPKLAQRPLFQVPERGESSNIDLRGELELAAHKMLARQLADLWLRLASEESAKGLANALAAGARPPYQLRVTSHLADLLLTYPETQRQRLSQMLAKQAHQLSSGDLLCFSHWVLDQPCPSHGAKKGQFASHSAPRAPSLAPSRPSSRRSKPAVAEIDREQIPANPSGQGGLYVGGSSTSPARTVTAAANAPDEWLLIRRIVDKLRLFAFDEASGRLAQEAASISGLTFVAHALGAVKEGRFEVRVSPNNQTPVRFAHGKYRVRARLALDYTREDVCRGGWTCLLSASRRHAKTERRDVVFNLRGENRWIDRQPSSFGHLLPLSADGGGRYASHLKEVRLAIESVQVELN